MHRRGQENFTFTLERYDVTVTMDNFELKLVHILTRERKSKEENQTELSRIINL